MRTPEFIEQLQKRTAEATISAQALRNQGAPGVVKVARDTLAVLNLWMFSRATRTMFCQRIDQTTNSMLGQFPPNAQSWGAARKALNLFLRDALYNRDLCTYYELDRIRSWLEVPLDRDVGTALGKEPEGSKLPTWQQIKKLNAAQSQDYQCVASAVAARKRMSRVDLDIYYWRPKLHVER
ncbi:MAG: hypothetical protein NTZ64_09635 [Polaromonas sp.]|nr:hypothetical protein [Polaromonas sp.]